MQACRRRRSSVGKTEPAVPDRLNLAPCSRHWIATAREAKCRWTYRVVWRDDDFGELRFIAVVNVANEPDALTFNDWIPIDAETWAILQQVKAKTEDGRKKR